jgi:precorrin-6B methylase 2
MNLDQIREQFRAFQGSRVLLTAFELDIFTFLDGGPYTSKEVSAGLKTDGRATDRLLNALCALGYLRKENGRFANVDVVGDHLVRGKPGFLSGLTHTAHLWETWGRLTEVVRTGRSAIDTEINNRQERWLSAFIEAMHNRAQVQAGPAVADLDLTGVTRVLDVGGGSGAFAMAFVRAGEGITATVFDLPNVVSLTRTYIEKEGLASRIDTCAGDYHTDPLPRSYDLVFLSAVVHSNSYGENEELLKKCAAALNPGGKVVVQDFIMDDSRTTPAHGALFALNMLTATAGGDTYTESEIQTWMRKAGLSDFVRIDQPFGTGQVIGVKK